jgi:hypothetical protein
MNAAHIATGLSIANLVLLGFFAFRVEPSTAAPTPSVLRAQLIELVDAKGAVRAQLKTEDDGTAVLRLRDGGGNIRVKLAADARGSGLLLANEQTEVGVHILSGVSSVTGEPGTAITIAEPGGAKTVIKPGGK